MMHASAGKYLFFFFIVCLGITAFFIFPPYGMDDCYITYRYAYNLFQHQQFVFNTGERILGTTSPLYTLILTIAQIFADDIPRMSNFISCICSSLAGFLLFLILKKENLPLGLFCAVSYPCMLQDIGLETNLLMFLFAAAVYLFTRDNYRMCSAALGLSFLTRQDSAPFIAAMILMYWLKKKKLPWSEFAVFSGIVAPWFIFSCFYFDALFPTALREKSGYANFMPYFVDSFWYLARCCDRYNFYLFSFLSQRVSPFLLPFSFFSQNVAAHSLAALYLCFTALSVIYYLKNVEKQHYAGALFYLYPSLMIIALSCIGPPPEHRWHLTAAVNFALIGQLNLFTTPLIARFKKRHPSSLWNGGRYALLMALLTCYLLCFAALNLKDFYVTAREADRSVWFGARYNNYKTIGCFLREQVSDEELVFVLEVGTMGYYSMKRMIDGAGIVSPGYGRYHREGFWLMGIEKKIPDYIVAREITIPYFEPIFSCQNAFGKMVVYKKLKTLPEDRYPFSQLLGSWKEQRARKNK